MFETELDNLISLSFSNEKLENESKSEGQEGEERQKEGSDNKNPVLLEEDSDENKEGDNIGNDTGADTGADNATSTRTYLNTLKQHGLLFLPDDFKEEGKEEEEIWEIAQAHTQSVYMNSAVESLLQSIPDDLRQAVSLAISGNDNYASVFNGQTNDFNLDTPEGKIYAIKSYYKEVMNWPDARIEKHLSKLDESDIEEEAEEAKNSIEEWRAEQAAEAIEKAKAEKEAIEAKKIKYQKDIKEEIKKASFIEDNRKPIIQNFMFNPVKKQDGIMTEYQRVIQKIQQNPAHMAQLADLLLEYDDKKGIAYDRFKRSAKTSLTQDLQRSLQKTVADKTKQISDSEIDWKSYIGKM